MVFKWLARCKVRNVLRFTFRASFVYTCWVVYSYANNLALLWRVKFVRLFERFVNLFLQVHWYRNTLRLDLTERRITEVRGSRHTLIIRKVHSSDFANYSCDANNAIGKNKQFVTLSGE